MMQSGKHAPDVIINDNPCDNVMVCSPEDVLQFWFRGDQRANYRDKWFPSQGVAQVQIDREIYSRFNSTFEEALSGHLESWKATRTHYVALIVVLDQFSRHIYRHLGLPDDAMQRKDADAAALSAASDLSIQLLDLPSDRGKEKFDEENEGRDKEKQGGLSMAQYVFSMMPYRHSATPERLTFVLSSMDTFAAQFTWETELLNKFRKQTVRRLQHLQDRVSADAAESILEHDLFQVDTTNVEVVKDMLKNKLVVAVEQFLEEHNKNNNDKNSSSKQNENVPISVSLSGGVDSMVILKILQILRDHGRQTTQHKLHCIGNNSSDNSYGSDIIAMHIDYANRNESALEADYVEWYCKQLGITFFKRVISEVTRGITDRTEYERVSREIRYDFYREKLSETGSRGVIFGHHQGDVQENVISNIMRGGSCLQLSGMGSVGFTNGVHVWRPLLSHCKDDIYAFAHAYGVPYFRDTTPSWSTRGKLRNQLVPLLIDMYGTGCLKSLSSLATDSDSSRELVEKNVYAPLLDAVKRYPCGLSVNITPFIHQSQCFWREILKTLMHSMGMAMVRDKAIGIFTDRVQGRKRVGGQEVHSLSRPNTGAGASASASAGASIPYSSTSKTGWLELRKNFSVELSATGDLIVFREGVLQGNLESIDLHQRFAVADIRKIEQGGERYELSIDNWKIMLSLRSTSTGKNPPSQTRILQTPQELLCGQFDYELLMPCGCEWIEFLLAKNAREGGRKTGAGKPPTPLVGIDMRLRSGLPLLVPVLPEVIKNIVYDDSSPSGGNSEGGDGSEGDHKGSSDMQQVLSFSYEYVGEGRKRREQEKEKEKEN